MKIVVEYSDTYVSEYDWNSFIELLASKFLEEREDENLNKESHYSLVVEG